MSAIPARSFVQFSFGVAGFNCARLRNAPGSCYIVSKKALNWPAAVAECAERHDGRLATLESSAELDAVMAYLKRIGGKPVCRPMMEVLVTYTPHVYHTPHTSHTPYVSAYTQSHRTPTTHTAHTHAYIGLRLPHIGLHTHTRHTA